MSMAQFLTTDALVAMLSSRQSYQYEPSSKETPSNIHKVKQACGVCGRVFGSKSKVWDLHCVDLALWPSRMHLTLVSFSWKGIAWCIRGSDLTHVTSATTTSHSEQLLQSTRSKCTKTVQRVIHDKVTVTRKLNVSKSFSSPIYLLVDRVLDDRMIGK